MRRREVIEKEWREADVLNDTKEIIKLEVALDIRELLLNISSKLR